jgi:hypothetical protein
VDDVTQTALRRDADARLGWVAPVVASLSALDDIRWHADTRACHGHGAAATWSIAGRARHGGIARWADLPLAGAFERAMSLKLSDGCRGFEPCVEQ